MEATSVLIQQMGSFANGFDVCRTGSTMCSLAVPTHTRMA